MGKVLDSLFEALAHEKEFEQLDSRLTEEYEKRMQEMKGCLQPEEYEQIQDVMRR